MGRAKVFVIGVGMTKFEKPGRRDNFDYPDMAKEAGSKALQDAGISYTAIEQAIVGYCFGDSTCGQRALYPLGMTGIPISNVNNNCSTGSTALFLAKQLVEGGIAQCVMALGFEKMQRGSLSSTYSDRVNPLDKHVEVMLEVEEFTSAPMTAQMFGNAGREHMRKYGTKAEHFAKIAYKNHLHSSNNPYSQFRTVYSMEQILASPMVHEPLTKLQCCPTSDGAACVILVSEDFVQLHGLQSRAVEILAQSMATDLPSTFAEKSCMKVVGYDMSRKAAQDAFKTAGITPDDVQVVELHDCFSANELITYEALGLCGEGMAKHLIDKGDNTYGGKYVINPSGGLISKGHPLGATGLAQCAELTWQLRGEAEKRQVADVRYCLQHNIGLGGAAVVTIYRIGFPQYRSNIGTKITSNVTTTEQAKQLNYSTTSEDSSNNVSGAPRSFQCASLFDEIHAGMKQSGKDYVQKIKGIFCFKVKKGNDLGVWVIDCKNGNGSVYFDLKGKGDVTFMIGDEDLVKLMAGQLDAQKAFFQGKLKLTGNMALAMKLKEFQLKHVPSKL